MVDACISVGKLFSITEASLCSLQEADMPEEVNIDDLIDLPNDEERVRKLRVSTGMDLCL